MADPVKEFGVDSAAALASALRREGRGELQKTNRVGYFALADGRVAHAAANGLGYYVRIYRSLADCGCSGKKK
ncbi:MAG: hypothetical protein A2Y38_22730 [Spirochaetes bacterium GWB1_59_5]|nr:MAG: hypothetical protein A2Y38_22730 [Spirochaetes bacterium GWB1_59_5]